MFSRRAAIGMVATGVSTYWRRRGAPLRWIIRRGRCASWSISAGRRDRYPGAPDRPAAVEKLGQQFVGREQPGPATISAPRPRSTRRPTAIPCCCQSRELHQHTLYANLKFDFVRDIVPIASFNRVPT